jgi:hypothetical protein
MSEIPLATTHTVSLFRSGKDPGAKTWSQTLDPEKKDTNAGGERPSTLNLNPELRCPGPILDPTAQTLTAVKRTWHTQDSQGQILAMAAFRESPDIFLVGPSWLGSGASGDKPPCRMTAVTA